MYTKNMKILSVLSVMLCAFTPVLAEETYQGFIGPYHPSNGTLPDGSGRGIWPTFRFGRTALQNKASDGDGWLLADDLEYHCDTYDVNTVMAIAVPPTEGGTVNNVNDTQLLRPSAHPGLIQGAHRFSRLAARCPQLSGFIIDDFLENYAGNETGCVNCPTSHPYIYGDKSSGQYCCPWPLTDRHCRPPPHAAVAQKETPALCCLVPGYKLACQGNPRCGVNPNNHTGCSTARIISLEDVMQIKGALLGKSIDKNGRVDLLSPSTTPHLRLFLVWYTRFTQNFVDDGLLSGALPSPEGKSEPLVPIVDGVSLWLEGPSQNAQYKQWTEQFNQFRTVTDAARTKEHKGFLRLAAYAGSYIEHSHMGILPPLPFKSMLQQSISLYDDLEIEGFFIFAGTSIPKLNQSMWTKWDLVSMMDSLQQPWLGRACGTVHPPFGRVDVHFGTGADSAGVFVTSKFVKNENAENNFCFDGWTGQKKPISHTVSVKGTTRSVQVFLKAGETVSFELK